MVTITTKNQAKTRANKPEEAETGAEMKSDMPSTSPAPAPEPADWTQNEDGSFSGPGGAKHWGDKHPKVAVASKVEAEALIREIDPTAKISGAKVTSQRDTVDTFIVEVGNRTIISGPLARLVGQSRGLQELTSGDGNPSVAKPQEGAGDETGGRSDGNTASSVGNQ